MAQPVLTNKYSESMGTNLTARSRPGSAEVQSGQHFRKLRESQAEPLKEMNETARARLAEGRCPPWGASTAASCCRLLVSGLACFDRNSATTWKPPPPLPYFTDQACSALL